MTTNAGESWIDITGTLATSNVGEIYSSEIIRHPTSGFGGLVVGTEYGPWLLWQNIINNISSSTTASSISWNKLGTKVPNVQINDMDYNAADDILVIGTFGRGAWSIKGIYPTLSNPSSIKSLTLRFTTGTPPTQVTTTQEIPLSSINLSGSNSVPITDAGILAAFNANPEGTIFTYSITANYGNDESGNAITSVTSPASNIPNFVPRPPPPPPISLAANGVTIKYTGPSTLTSNPLFIQADPRGTGMEWFAVVYLDPRFFITSYANNEEDGINFFKPPGQANPVIFNNIVTTLMTDMTNTFYNATTFNQNISSWDISNSTSIGQMFGNAGAFNNRESPDIGKWDTSKVDLMNFTFYNATNFNQDISTWNVGLVTPKPPIGFRTGSALITSNMPPAFR
jgi:hypothetical protein